MAGKERQERKFEDAMAELEKVVDRLESGELSLEESLGAFQEGVGLVQYCNQKLNEVERKIELLVKDKDGKLELKGLDPIVQKDIIEEE
ncbi:MAG: exodeoxyribonuclease VII small subunit [Candidatus Binatia bacterium]|jgi:exodeoxyribonuclease VII small subunit